jgi:hypothetical protein
LEAGAAVITALLLALARSRWARRAVACGVLAGAVLLFVSGNRRAGERVGRLAERLDATEKANEIQRRMLEAAANRPRDRDELARRLRDGRF